MTSPSFAPSAACLSASSLVDPVSATTLISVQTLSGPPTAALSRTASSGAAPTSPERACVMSLIVPGEQAPGAVTCRNPLTKLRPAYHVGQVNWTETDCGRHRRSEEH